ALNKQFSAMESDARAALERDFGKGQVTFERHAEMRYAGQRHNIKVPISGLDDPAGIRTAFDRDYKRRYGHADSRAAAEFQALHLPAITRLERPDLKRLPRALMAGVPSQKRPVYFGQGEAITTHIYDRATLAPGFKANGPALIEEYGSTA